MKQECIQRELKVLVVSNIIHEPYMNKAFQKRFSTAGYHCNIVRQDVFEILDRGERGNVKYDIILIWLNFEVLHPELSSKNCTEIKKNTIEFCSYVTEKISEYYDGEIFFVSLENYYDCIYHVVGNIVALEHMIDTINIELVKGLENTVFIDFKQVIARVGISNAYSSNRNKYLWNSPYSREIYQELSNDIYKQYMAMQRVKYKCIILDCDNVLWGGSVAEELMQGIQLSDFAEGRMYKDFQRFLYKLYLHGMLLIVLSKNDKEDVLNIFRHHSDMVLKEEYITLFEVSWDSKAKGIKKIAETLNLGIDSFIFVDDSDFEIREVQTILPEVKTILFNLDTIYEKFDFLNLKSQIDEKQILIRNNSYRELIKYNALKQKIKSNQEYLDIIQTNVHIQRADRTELGRISELSMRTNRLTNGMRYTKQELDVLKEKGSLYAVYVSDIFGNLGLVGAIGINNSSLCLYCLSCRALGRKVEEKMLVFIKENHEITKCYFKDTPKNQSVRELFTYISDNLNYIMEL